MRWFQGLWPTRRGTGSPLHHPQALGTLEHPLKLSLSFLTHEAGATACHLGGGPGAITETVMCITCLPFHSYTIGRPRFTALCRLLRFFFFSFLFKHKLNVCGNPALSKPIGSIFLTAFFNLGIYTGFLETVLYCTLNRLQYIV